MIITVDPDRSFHDRVLRAVAGTSWADRSVHVDDPGRAPAVVDTEGVPAVVIVGPRVAIPAATSLAQRVTAGAVPAAVLIVTEPTNEVLRSAMRAGARDVLPPNFSDDELRAAIDRTALADATEPTGPGMTVAVFSTKGGVGTSTLAANLAARLGDRLDAEAVLLDLDVASADQAIMHSLTPSWTLQELVDGSVGTDSESFRQVLQTVDGSTASVLPGPLDPALAETITGDAVARVISASRSVAPLVVLDTASAFDDRTLAAIDAADVVVVVSSLDVAALRALTVALQTFDRIGVDPATVRIALVRADSKSGLQVTDVERAIGRIVDVRIPSARAVVRSLNEGIPLAVSSPRSNYVQAVDELVDSVLELGASELRAAADAGSRGWFGRGRARGGSSEVVRAEAGGSPAAAQDLPVADEPRDDTVHPSIPAAPPPGDNAVPASSGDGRPPVSRPDTADAVSEPSTAATSPPDVDGRSGTDGAAKASDPATSMSRAATSVAVAEAEDGRGSSDGETVASAREVETLASAAPAEDAASDASRTNGGVSLDALPPPRATGQDDDDDEDKRQRRFGLRR